jgi:cytochrome c oxidase cbb3-type subunit IV
MNYETLSDFAETWGLAYMVVLFAGVLIYALRPKSKAKFERHARIPLNED